MPLFLCRWPNGDSSVVWARNRDHAIAELDQVGNAEGCPLIPIRTFQLHLALTERGELALEGLGEGTREEIVSAAYPLLDKALHDAYGDEGDGSIESLSPDRRGLLAHAVECERGRIAPDARPVAEPATEIGRNVKRQTDLPTVLVDRLVRQVGKTTLKRFKGRTRPS